MLIIGLICALLGAIVAIIAGRSITGPLIHVTEIVNEVNSISGQNKEIIDNFVVAVSRFKV